MYPQAYIQYLVHFHCDRDYFECHEILEEYWKEVAPGKKDSIWVGLIQLAVGAYHHRRRNFNGAKKTLEKSLMIFLKEKDSLAKLGLNGDKLIEMCNQQLKNVNEQTNYRSQLLPINDPVLLEQCIEKAMKMRLTWGHESDLSNQNMIHKHSLRDRSEVIAERKRALIQKGSDQV